jgi:cycloartenol synthase
LYVLQFKKENPLKLNLPAMKLEENQDVTEEAVSTSLKRAISRFSTLQAHDGHWPGDYGGPMFLMPGLVLPLAEQFIKNFFTSYLELTHCILSFTQLITLYVTGALNTVLSSEHQKEIRRYLYNHQARIQLQTVPTYNR